MLLSLLGFAAGYLVPCFCFPVADSLITGGIDALLQFEVVLTSYASLHWPLKASNYALLTTNIGTGALGFLYVQSCIQSGLTAEPTKWIAATLAVISIFFIALSILLNTVLQLPGSWSATWRNLFSSAVILSPALVLTTRWLLQLRGSIAPTACDDF